MMQHNWGPSPVGHGELYCPRCCATNREAEALGFLDECPGPPEPAPDLGPCCNCGSTEDVRNVLMLNHRAPVPGTGWGCVVCNLPHDGAVAVLCDSCADKGDPIRAVCVGYPKNGKRMPLDQLPQGDFEHDPNVEH
jgi:hypothetical protein